MRELDIREIILERMLLCIASARSPWKRGIEALAHHLKSLLRKPSVSSLQDFSMCPLEFGRHCRLVYIILLRNLKF